MQLHEKFKEIRKKLLKMSQSDLAMAFGATQKDISLLENGKKEFIPNRYLEYLTRRDIDLNSLFHPQKKVYKREDFSSCEGESDYFSEKAYPRESSQASWMARECNNDDKLKEKDSALLNSSDEQIALEKVMEVLYGIRELLNRILNGK